MNRGNFPEIQATRHSFDYLGMVFPLAELSYVVTLESTSFVITAHGEPDLVAETLQGSDLQTLLG